MWDWNESGWSFPQAGEEGFSEKMAFDQRPE